MESIEKLLKQDLFAFVSKAIDEHRNIVARQMRHAGVLAFKDQDKARAFTELASGAVYASVMELQRHIYEQISRTASVIGETFLVFDRPADIPEGLEPALSFYNPTEECALCEKSAGCDCAETRNPDGTAKDQGEEDSAAVAFAKILGRLVEPEAPVDGKEEI